MYPPGLRKSKADLMTFLTSLNECHMRRKWMKSNFLLNIHSSSQSSISKWQLGGTNSGCIGLKSVPRTDAEGYCNAETGPSIQESVLNGKLILYLPKSIAHIPVPG